MVIKNMISNILPEEKLPTVVGQSDALMWNFKMYHCGRRQWFTRIHNRDCLAYGLRTGQRFRFTCEQVQNVACGTLTDELLLSGWMYIQRMHIMIGNHEFTGQRQRSDGVLIDERRQRCKDWLVSASLQADTTRRWLDKEVSHQFVAMWSLWLHVRRWIGHLNNEAVRLGECGRVAHEKRTGSSIAEQRACLVTADGWLVPVFRWVAHKSDGYLKIRIVSKVF